MVYYEKISNKDSLLVTIGDSWTEGVGCYDYDLLDAFYNYKITKEELYRQCHVRGSYHADCWPAKLSKMLNCDLINIAEGGDSNSGSAKRLIQDYHNIISEKSKNYKKITVIWLISAPERFSFYSNKIVTNFIQESDHKIKKAYFKDVLRDDKDSLLETSFYLRAVYWYCKANNFNFIYGSAFYPILEINEIFNPENNIHRYIPFEAMSKYLDGNDPDIWSFCRHPNARGYAIIAEKLYDIINKNFNNIL